MPDEIVLEEVRRLRLEPGDTLIVRVTDLTPRQMDGYQEALEIWFPDNPVRVIHGAEILVEPAAAEPQCVISDEAMDQLAKQIAKRLGLPPNGGVRTPTR